MKKIKKKETLSKRLCVLCLTLITVLLSATIGGCATMETTMEKGKNKDYINYISFSNDGKKILFDRRKDDQPYMIHVYDLETGELHAYKPPDNERWSMARYSFDGKKIVFSIIPRGEIYLQLDRMQLAIMDPDGKNIQRITTSAGPKIYPSFSHSGKKIIYVHAATVRDKGRTPAADYDIYEVDIDTGKEARLSWFKYFMMSEPYYFPDDETIIFSAFGTPNIFPGIAENDREAIKKKKAEIESIRKSMRGELFLDDDIYVMQKKQKELPEPLIRSKDGLRRPLLTKDGVIFFETQAYKPNGKGDGSQYFQYAKDGNYRRITNIKATTIWSGAVSSEGNLLAIVVNQNNRRIVIYNLANWSSREITLPDQPARIINR